MTKSTGFWFGMLLCAALVGCSSPHHGGMGHGSSERHWEKAQADIAALVRKHVADPQKAQEARAVTEDIVKEIRESRERSRQYHRQLYELNAKYEATPEEFTTILDDMHNRRMQSATRILGLRFKLKHLLTAQEWDGLSQDMMTHVSHYPRGSEPSSRSGGY